jgi:hypothetical protein
MKTRLAFLTVLTLAICGNAFAYAEGIHSIMTEYAFRSAHTSYASKLGSDFIQDKAQLKMTTGAYHEDDGLMPLNHFLDPVHGVPLKVLFPACGTLGDRADQYAVTNSDNAVSFANDQYAAAVVGPNPGTRGAHADELFTMLGHEVHLVEDMAQPEHTRNDQHRFAFAATAASIYEEWGAENLIVDAGRGLPAVPYDGYDPVDLPQFLDYFHTGNGKGLADFSNGNFFTQDTNVQDESVFFKCETFGNPRLDLSDATLRQEDVNEEYRTILGPVTQVVTEKIWTSHPYDALRNISEIDSYHDLSSIIDLETRVILAEPTYSLATASYLTRASMLVPRAVGYAAGYVDHFFRGNLGVQWTKQASSELYDLKITNNSTQTLSDDATVQALFLAKPSYFGRATEDDTSNVVPKTAIKNFVPSFAGLGPGESVTIPDLAVVDLAPGDNLNDFERRTVVRGRLGSEQAVMSLVQGSKPRPELRFEVSWVGHNLISPPDPAIGTTQFDTRIGASYWYPNYCDTWSGVDWCFTGYAPASGDSVYAGSATFTVSKNVSNRQYWVTFCNTAGGAMDVTVKTFGNDVLKNTYRVQGLDMTFNNRCRSMQFYP